MSWNKQYGTNDLGQRTIVITEEKKPPYVSPFVRLNGAIMKIFIPLVIIAFLLTHGI